MSRKREKRSGLTLVELMIAAAVLMIALTGSMAYRYYATMDAKKADVQMTAARTGMTLLQGWLGANGLDAVPAFDPTATFPATNFTANGVKVETSIYGPAALDASAGWTSYGLYKITTADGVVYTARLSSKPADTVSTPNVPRALNVQIGWRLDRTLGAPDKVMGSTTYMPN